MSDKIYSLKITDSGAYVIMTYQDFAGLAGELGRFGVDVEIQKDTTPGEIFFKLKETTRNQ